MKSTGAAHPLAGPEGVPLFGPLAGDLVVVGGGGAGRWLHATSPTKGTVEVGPILTPGGY